ncbi:DUF7504 family protein [Halobellus rufus]|uniref:DUF7504 family protein n=1 Tax=Halobellus rufus TaxID=1448860 RepID=UPI000678A7E9|nr:hypothetical protein [Halobellus rufus]
MEHGEDESSTEDDDPSSSLADLADRLGGDSTANSSGPDGGSSLSDLAESIETRGGSMSTEEIDDSDLGRWEFVDRDAGGSAADPKTEALLELTGGASNVLLSGPGDCPAEQDLCARLMESGTDDPVNLLVVSISETPSQRLSTLESYLEGPVGETAVVDVRNYNRETSYENYDGPVDVRTVSNAQDLRRIGIVTSKLLTEWDDVSGPVTMCVHSLSDLLDVNEDHQQVFRFLHVLRGRVQSAGVRAHYHFDPTRYEGQTVRTFESLFDTVLQFDEDGSVGID